MPTTNEGATSVLSQPAQTLSQAVGIALFNSINATSEFELLALKVAPLIVIFVGPSVLAVVAAQTGFGLIQPKRNTQLARFCPSVQ